MFYNKTKGEFGILKNYDVVAFDDVQCLNNDKIASSIYDFLASGNLSRSNNVANDTSRSSLVFLSNYTEETQKKLENNPYFLKEVNLFEPFSDSFQKEAFKSRVVVLPAYLMRDENFIISEEDVYGININVLHKFFQEKLKESLPLFKIELSCKERLKNNIYAIVSGLSKLLFDDLESIPEKYLQAFIQLAEKLVELYKPQMKSVDEIVSLTDLFDKIKSEDLKTLKVIIKADVQGSAEALKESLLKLSNEEVEIEIIHSAVGVINESDINLADTADAIIIGFNVRSDSNATLLAKAKHIDVKYYNVIYNAIEDVEKAIKGMLKPVFTEKLNGIAEVRDIFKISGVGVIAGSHVIDGKIIKNARARLIRNGKEEYDGTIASLKHEKDDVKEMGKNFDCGIQLLNYQDIKAGDTIECYSLEEVEK